MTGRAGDEGRVSYLSSWGAYPDVAKGLATLDVGRSRTEADIRLDFMMGWTPPDGIDVPKWRC